jgi:hypothetical protein
VALLFARIIARVRMGSLFWSPFRVGTRSHGQVDYRAHELEPVVNKKIREQVCFDPAC